MNLLCLLLILALERVVVKGRLWCIDFYVSRYVHFADSQFNLKQALPLWQIIGLAAAPAIIVQLLMLLVHNQLLQGIISAAVLMVCIGCPDLRACYKHYLQAANRGDTEACEICAEQLGHDPERAMSLGQTLVWINYRFYVAVMIWFAFFGAAGAVLYVVSRNLLRYSESNDLPHSNKLHDWVKILDWVPVRITTLGFVFMGHFSKAFPVWIAYLAEWKPSALKILSDVGKAAEETPIDHNDLAHEPYMLLKLAKRNLLFILVVISVLTLTGFIN
ncbi:beta-lactamase regulator AmpE [Neptunicella marina]|uniref:Beta-lactamase regulator AmpE n=1 Tax=Neptunicella marina TaxID=2125989 RepID=A0A8J6ITI6_9ALTE|nr:beta-lactamase regulator AmpE [Neptunicella marina]MBC3765318.1 beta-lactamase regulator AmpE [Neptunicella marina]